MVNVETIGKIKGLGTVKVCSANFYDQLNSLKEAGIKYPISVRDTAYMRLNNGPKDWTRTCHAPIWYKDAPLILARISPLVENLEMAKQAVEANRKNKYFSTNDAKLYEKYAEIAKKDEKKSPNKRRVITLPSDANFKLNGMDKISQALFEDTAVEYFKKFAPNGITFYTPDRDYTQDKNGTGVSYLWFSSPDCVSVLFGNDRFLCNVDYRAFGVSRGRGHAEGVAHEKLPYSAEEINRLIKIAENIRKGNQLNSKLEDIIKFLNKLK